MSDWSYKIASSDVADDESGVAMRTFKGEAFSNEYPDETIPFEVKVRAVDTLVHIEGAVRDAVQVAILRQQSDRLHQSVTGTEEPLALGDIEDSTFVKPFKDAEQARANVEATERDLRLAEEAEEQVRKEQQADSARQAQTGGTVAPGVAATEPTPRAAGTTNRGAAVTEERSNIVNRPGE